MSHQSHPEFLPPSNVNVPLWRFMDLERFTALVSAKSLYFARGDAFQGDFDAMLTEQIDKTIFETADSSMYDMWREAQLSDRLNAYISCWHATDAEPERVWEKYGAHAAVAIKSTYWRLCRSFDAHLEPVYIGLVHYGAEDLAASESLPNGFAFWMHKQRSCEPERELRALIWRPRNFPVAITGAKRRQLVEVARDVSTDSSPTGVLVPVPLDELIETVVAPAAAPRHEVTHVEELLKGAGVAARVVSL
jgi:hypothetical protein